MRVIFIRHGQAESNVDILKRMVGQHADLTEVGRHQVEKTASYLGKISTANVIYSSDIARALQTAQIIAKELNVRIVLDRRLREIDKGIWTGRPISEVIQLEGESTEDSKHTFRPPGGENWEDVGKRIASFVRAKHRAGEKEIIAVSHDHPIRMGIGFLLKKPIETWEDMPLDNASVTALNYENGIWNLDEVLHNVRPYLSAKH